MGSTENEERNDAVIAAEGLGTRRSEWSRYFPRESLPTRGIPGIVHLMNEIVRAGRVRATMVHHPCYEDLILSWAGRPGSDR